MDDAVLISVYLDAIGAGGGPSRAASTAQEPTLTISLADAKELSHGVDLRDPILVLRGAQKYVGSFAKEHQSAFRCV